jgi:hypothetical protein
MAASASIGFALARGKAVIASDLPENRGLGCVRLFPTGDAAGLRDAVREVSGAPDVKRSLEQAALAYSALHTYQGLASRLIEIYNSITVVGTPSHRYSK